MKQRIVVNGLILIKNGYVLGNAYNMSNTVPSDVNPTIIHTSPFSYKSQAFQ